MQTHRRFLQIPFLLLTALTLLTACLPVTAGTSPDFYPRGQSFSQLHLERSGDAVFCGAWIPYFTCNTLLETGDAVLCRTAVGDYLDRAKACGINAVFVHVCAFGEAYYPSRYYPQAAEAKGIDLMQLMTEECARTGIRLHAWINPLRLQTKSEMDAQEGDALLCAWYRSEQTRSANLRLWSGRYYLNPAAPAAADFLSGVAAELTERYQPAGIHIDDYFYPTDDEGFDAEDFAASGASDRSAWRTENISALVGKIYGAVHDTNEKTIFSISPQGNLEQNAQTLFADVTRWLAEPGFCDLMIPQIYFGYRNEASPFTETAEKWTALPRAAGVGLAVGLAAYKVGAPDLNAGSGQGEWADEYGVLSRQARQILADPSCCGTALYHLDAVLGLPEREADLLRAALRGNTPVRSG